MQRSRSVQTGWTLHGVPRVVEAGNAPAPRKWLSAKGLDSFGEVVITRLRQEFPQACRLDEIHCPLRL